MPPADDTRRERGWCHAAPPPFALASHVVNRFRFGVATCGCTILRSRLFGRRRGGFGVGGAGELVFDRLAVVPAAEALSPRRERAGRDSPSGPGSAVISLLPGHWRTGDIHMASSIRFNSGAQSP